MTAGVNCEGGCHEGALAEWAATCARRWPGFTPEYPGETPRGRMTLALAAEKGIDLGEERGLSACHHELQHLKEERALAALHPELQPS